MVLAVLSGPLAEAQDASRDTLGWHVVKPGESLQSITERYLGTPDLWPENARLNPGIRRPDLIRPGQRIRVIVAREVPARQVEINKISRQVDKNLQLTGWRDAVEGDLLKPRDGVRTHEKSSTELRFDDDSYLTLNEYSQVFVKDVRTTLTGVRRDSIEIERGQAELVFNAPRPDMTEIEVVTGSAVTRPQVGPSQSSTTRARKSEAGGSQVMVYGGKAEVESAGVKVDVPYGMGTAVPQGAAPAPPEKLLPRSVTVSPARGSEWAYANPRFSWRPVTGAASYTVEVCRDTRCGELVARAIGLEATTWQPDALPRGDLYWRVTAVAPSGLDGFPSRAVRFRVLTDLPDLEPPVVVAVLRGAGDVTAEGRFVLGDGGALELVARDDAAGVAEVRYRWDGGGWKRYAGGAIAPPSAGEHRLEFSAEDRLGRAAPVWPVAVERDASAPPSPQVEAEPP